MSADRIPLKIVTSVDLEEFKKSDGWHSLMRVRHHRDGAAASLSCYDGEESSLERMMQRWNAGWAFVDLKRCMISSRAVEQLEVFEELCKRAAELERKLVLKPILVPDAE